MDFEVLETENFLFHCYRSDRDIEQDIANKVEESVLSVSLVFSAPRLPRKFDFYICPNIESFILLTGMHREDYQSWMVGNTDWNSGRVCVISPRAVTDRSEADMYRVIAHEAVHVVMDSIGSAESLPMWLTEGVAILFADQIPSAESLDQNSPPPVGSLSGSGFSSLGGYRYAGAYVRHFLELYGADVLKRVYSGEESVDGYITEGFERDAVLEYKNRCK